MKELLEQWSRLEPERCRYHGNDVAEVGRFSIVLNGHEYPINYLSFAQLPAHQGNIQVAVQEAIAARDWRWTGGSGYSALKHSVTIYGARPDCPFLKQAWSDRLFVDAILEAYVEALGQELEN